MVKQQIYIQKISYKINIHIDLFVQIV